MQLRASARGWADLYLRENPWHNRRRCSEDEWRDKALQQGMVAVNSILRDWMKGQIMAVETGLTEFRHVAAGMKATAASVARSDTVPVRTTPARLIADEFWGSEVDQ
ncbi:MAG: hypothetical protein OXJ62_14100 [Spirochaetaceae bacterium]|nr:hypothetical protein [Spirochaetaceae bacterium]